MKYLESYKNLNIKYPEEIIKMFNYLKGLIKKYLVEEFGDHIINNIRLEKNKINTYSITFEAYRYYFIFQFDYKEDGLWIKYLNSCEEPLLTEIHILGKLFDNIAIKKTEYSWNIDDSKLLSEINNIDLYSKLNKYNL